MVQRRGAALGFAYLKPDPLPNVARAAILDAIAVDDLEDSFIGLPWDFLSDVDRDMLQACLDAGTSQENRDRAG